MTLEQFLKYIDRKSSVNPDQRRHKSAGRKNKLLYATVVVHNGNVRFTISDSRLANNIPIVHRKNQDNSIVALKWINTRNAFSRHILQNLLDYQYAFWRSGRETALKPLTLKQFLQLYPFKYLDQSRLSRLIPTLLVETPQRKVITLRDLFPSKKRCIAYRIEEIINDRNALLKDKDIQNVLAREGIHLSIRTICNCRKLLNIPNYKKRISTYYGKDTRFSDYIKLCNGQSNKIPPEAGIYELSTSGKIQYDKNQCEILYIGASKDLRKRLLNYSGEKIKNGRLTKWVNGSDIFVRYFLTENYLQVERKLLKQFKQTYGELPKGNKLGG